MPTDLLHDLLDLVLPRGCPGCGRPARLLCADCTAVLGAPPLGPVRPSPCPPGLPPVRALGGYDGPLKALLLAHKERGRLALARPLGVALAAPVGLLGAAGPVLLCPVPSSAAAVRRRGHDPAWRLARAAAAAVPGAHAARLLTQARRTLDQSGLSTEQRRRNLHGALRATVPGTPTWLPVVVVDDVMTTGATLVEASRALRDAGHRVLGAAVLAATARRDAIGHSVGGETLHPAGRQG